MSRAKKQPATPTVRYAIYTRKSTEGGLEQEFNSLAVRPFVVMPKKGDQIDLRMEQSTNFRDRRGAAKVT